MNGPGDEHGDWLLSLTKRLRAHYDRPDDAARLAELEQRLAGLRPHNAALRYRVTQPIAIGGMGIVEAAIDGVLDREVALKRAVTTESPASTRHNQLRLLTEAEIVGRLEHPGIVPIHDVGLTDTGEPFFAMQRVAGKSLMQRIDERADLREIVAILIRVCEVMSYAHSRDTAHRDLKPDNVMVGTFGEVYVMDWGLACALATDGAPDHATRSPAGDPGVAGTPFDGLTIPGSILGTPAYLAPERLERGDGPTDLVLVDVYSVGAMLYHALVGRRPFDDAEDKTIGELLDAIRDDSPRDVLELQPYADAELAAVCARAMQREPGARYPDMRALAADLQAWTEHRIVKAHGGGLRTNLTKWVRRNRAIAITIAAATFTLLGAGAWFVNGVTEARDAATANLREVMDLAVIEQVRDLRQRAETRLWPLSSDRSAALAAWLDEAKALRVTLRSLQDRRARLNADTPASAAPANRARTELAWRSRQLTEVITELERFFAPVPDSPPLSLDSGFAAVSQRAAAASALAEAAISDARAARSWRVTIAAIASSPRYDGLTIRPQRGLLPVGQNPATGLFEFVHLQSGRAPGAPDSSPDEHDGMVLVLLPRGRFTMGATTGGPPNHDPMAEAINETPAHEIELAPFFLAKHEMTQAQWLRITGHNPSVHDARSVYVEDARAPLHPVESVDWTTARSVLRKLGLALPTEAQWEYAARAGTNTPWYSGHEVEDLLDPPAGNLADASSADALGAQGWRPTPGLDDGYVMHAPIGSFAPNQFGLHDMVGNVAEWCEDEYVSYEKPPRPGDGGRPVSDSPSTVMYRGGAFDQPAQEARSANRAGGPPDRRHFALGIRPARALEL